MAFYQKNQKIYMVTGKGGVGKSVIAATLAKQLARQGYRTLLVELGDQSFFEMVFGRPVTYQPVFLEENLDAALWSGHACLREYVQYLLRIEKLVELFFDNRVMKTFIRAAPALKELAILGKVTSGIREWGPPLEYDRIVVDGYATGHFMALLKAPVGMGQLIVSGPMGEQSRSIHKVLCDGERTQYFVVSLLEELPITETLELCAELREWIGVEPHVVANKCFTHEFSTMAQMKEQAPPDFRQVLHVIENLVVKTREGLARLQEAAAPLHTAPFVFSARNADVIETLAQEARLL